MFPKKKKKKESWAGKQPKCASAEEMINKMWHIYTMEYYSAIKKNEIMLFEATKLDLEIVILSEVSHMTSHICRNIKRNDTNELIYKKRSRLNRVR